MRHTQKVELTDADRKRIAEIEKEIDKIVAGDECPPVIDEKICKNCSYYEFCYVGE